MPNLILFYCHMMHTLNSTIETAQESTYIFKFITLNYKTIPISSKTT